MNLTLETIQSLVDLATDKQLAELTVETDDQKITIKTAAATPILSQAVPMQAIGQPVAQKPVAETGISRAPEETQAKSNYYQITAPMVGTFYRSPAPDAPPFAEEGYRISKGQTVCIIEAMKLMNELESEVSGIVRRILVENGQPVEFGQPLMEIEVQ